MKRVKRRWLLGQMVSLCLLAARLPAANVLTAHSQPGASRIADIPLQSFGIVHPNDAAAVEVLVTCRKTL